MEGNQMAKKGTTTVGIICSDGLVFAADKRASMGYFIAAKDVDKIHQLDERIALTIAGSVADAQSLVRLMQAELKLYKMRNGEPMSVSAATTMLSNIMFQYKMFPFYVQLLLGGYDKGAIIY
ncbi:MAG: proteasome subunit beta, partial [Candidatus Burarchaeum sp.]|nr:proteasome subunit beta [Candidatus Burarchaeum sp.]